MSRLFRLAMGVFLCGCARTELAVSEDAAVVVDGAREAGCHWTFGEVYRFAPVGRPTGFSFSDESHLRGVAWDGNSAWVITLSAGDWPADLGHIRLHHLDGAGAPITPASIIAEQPVLWEVYADLVIGDGSGLVVFNGCPDSGCAAVCDGRGFVREACEPGPSYVARMRSFDRNGVLGPSRLLLASGRINNDPLIAAPTGRSHVVITQRGRQAISESGLPGTFNDRELPSPPLQAFGIPDSTNGVVGFSWIDSNFTFHVVGPDAITQREVRVPGATAVARVLSLSADGRTLAFGGRQRVDVVSLGGDYLHAFALAGTVLDVDYVGDLLYVMATDGPGNLEDREIEIIAFDADGAEVGREELPHRGQGLLATDSGALVFTFDPEDYAPMAYSARCEP